MANPLELQQITKIFSGGTSGVKSISFTIAPGEGFSLLGPSGCGKSTTLRIIGGFEKPDSGKIFHGKDITNLPPQKRDIRTVFQRYALFPHLTVTENIAFGLRMQKQPESIIKQKISWALALLEIEKLVSRPIQKLSGGEQQRVALARALVTQPSVLLLDEPLSALDLKLREKMQMELLSLRKKLGTTFLFVTHDQNEAMALSDTVAVMNEGDIQQIGSPEEIYHRPSNRFVAEFIGQANFIPKSKLDLINGSKDHLPKLLPQQNWMIRPEHFTPREKNWVPLAGHVAISVTVLESAFLGADRLTKVKDDSDNIYLLKTQGFEPAPGNENEIIQISWECSDTWTVGSI